MQDPVAGEIDAPLDGPTRRLRPATVGVPAPPPHAHAWPSVVPQDAPMPVVIEPFAPIKRRTLVYATTRPLTLADLQRSAIKPPSGAPVVFVMAALMLALAAVVTCGFLFVQSLSDLQHAAKVVVSDCAPGTPSSRPCAAHGLDEELARLETDPSVGSYRRFEVDGAHIETGEGPDRGLVEGLVQFDRRSFPIALEFIEDDDETWSLAAWYAGRP